MSRVQRSAAAVAALLSMWVLGACQQWVDEVELPGLIVESEYHLAGALVLGAARNWAKTATRAARIGDPLPIGLSMYCLRGTTRRDSPVRKGIVAADPRFFPLGAYIELYAGRTYLGRFLVDDTGKRIKGSRIDLWTPDCRLAGDYGIQRGTAVRTLP